MSLRITVIPKGKSYPEVESFSIAKLSSDFVFSAKRRMPRSSNVPAGETVITCIIQREATKKNSF